MIQYSVFTKPWPDLSIEELAAKVKNFGFNGIELPLRPGFQVTPGNAEETLPEVVKIFAEHDLKIFSIAGDPTSKLVKLAGENSIPIIRTMVRIDFDKGYLQCEKEYIELLKKLEPELKEYNVKVGIQNHDNDFVTNVSGVRRIVEHFEKDQAGFVWDPAHCALAGEIPKIAIDIVWSHLCMVNFKNAIPIRTTGAEAEEVKWSRYWSQGNMGVASWTEVVGLLKEWNYSGVVCCCAEYRDHDSLDRLTQIDLGYLKKLFAK